ncbi:hypothetical protein Ade02nite_70180 [Paractinoplanes deccanensis]|uniref:Carboxypeptidase regulatory-like domain-containing protein n=1 Tax=Paractinoplanes deccanensis TaxID=113561 RepID=A0ABQ3YEF2_9ACTN|nr:hypothetical protein [Actinoplanes deccanensis]GID78377.1 hypothetical protein Ade02nite_70180 [Actinoplanes deccanensis]
MTDPLVSRLEAMLDGVDPVPSEVVEAALAAYDWRDPDAQLATLVDTATAATTTAGVRGDGGTLRTFQAGTVEADIETSSDGGSVVLLGQLAPPSAMTVRAEQPGGVRETQSDEWGRFAFQGLTPGPLRLSFGGARTPWMVV